jgi:hypothetical protein
VFFAMAGHLTGRVPASNRMCERSASPVAFWLLVSLYWVFALGFAVAGIFALLRP